MQKANKQKRRDFQRYVLLYLVIFFLNTREQRYYLNITNVLLVSISASISVPVYTDVLCCMVNNSPIWGSTDVYQKGKF